MPLEGENNELGRRFNHRVEFRDDELFFYHFEYSVDKMKRKFLEEVEIREFQPIQKKRIEEALAFAEKAHKNDPPRKDGSPAVIHPIEVAYLFLKGEKNVSAVEVCALLLHDVREDNKDYAKLNDKDFKKVCRGQILAAYTNLLSKTVVMDGEAYKLQTPLYFQLMIDSISAVLMKCYDRVANLKSDGRQTHKILKLIQTGQIEEAKEGIKFIEEYIVEAEEWIIPLAITNEYLELNARITEKVRVLKERCRELRGLIELQRTPILEPTAQ